MLYADDSDASSSRNSAQLFAMALFLMAQMLLNTDIKADLHFQKPLSLD